MDAIARFASLVAPPRCAACGESCAAEEIACARCLSTLGSGGGLAAAVPGLEAVWAATSHDGVGRELVAALKFGRLLPVAGLIAEAIASAAPAEMLAFTPVPVPPAPRRRLQRGFDPAEQIAAALGRITGRAAQGCLGRGDGPRQVGRPRAGRLAAPPRVHARRPVPAEAVLVDDVHTTGATLGACARALRGAGTRRVAAVTFARTLMTRGDAVRHRQGQVRRRRRRNG